jgi:hypothetical protein
MNTCSKPAIFTFFACLAIAECGWATPSILHGDALQGRVTAEETNAPLPNAIILVLWKGNSIPTGLFAHSIREVCFFAATTVTDANGFYRTDPWSEPNLYNVDKSYARVFVYKKDYWLPSVYVTNYPGSSLGAGSAVFPNIVMKRFKGTAEQRLAQFRAEQNICTHAPNQDPLFPFTTAQYEEARTIAEKDDPTVVNLRSFNERRMRDVEK